MSIPPRFGRGAALAGLAIAALFTLQACGRERAPADATPISFAILSAEGQASAEPQWRPLLDDMSRAVGAPVEARFGADYAELVTAMGAGRVDLAWFSARPAVEAIDQGGVELLARTVDAAGDDSYRSLLIVRKESGLTLDRALTCDRSLKFGAGDPASTSGALAPATFLFGPRRFDPERCFASSRVGNHQDNAFAVASGVIDLAVSNTATLLSMQRQNPQMAEQVEAVWRSEPLPEGGVLARARLDPAAQEKVRSFLLSYGQGTGVQAERQRAVLAALNYSAFRAADDAYLNPVREMMAGQALAQARASGDAAAARRAEADVRRLRAQREVQP